MKFFKVLKQSEHLFQMINSSKYKDILKIFHSNENSIKDLIQILRAKRNSYYNNVQDKIDENFMPLLQTHEFRDKLFPLITRGDGNCFYYAISKILFGTDIHFCKIRLAVVFILIEYKVYFKRVLQKSFGPNKYPELIENTAKDKSWANEYILLATSIMINRPLICLTDTEKDIYSHEYCVNKDQIKNQQLFISLKSFHFVPLLSKEEIEFNIEAKINQFKRFKLFRLKLYK